MPEVNINVLREAPDLKQLAEEVAKMQKVLRWILNGQIDFENIRARSIKGENIEAETITAGEIAAEAITTDKLDAEAVTADKIDAGAVTTDKLEAGAVTAVKIDVEELSAISADLGHITAGLIEAIQIFGSYIATAQGTYPRAEMSSVDNLIAAYRDADNYVALIPATSGSPGYGVYSGTGIKALMQFITNEFLIITVNGYDLEVNSGKDLILSAPSGLIRISNWSKLYSDGDGQTLQQALNSKQDTIVGASGSFPAGAMTVTVTNGIVTSIV